MSRCVTLAAILAVAFKAGCGAPSENRETTQQEPSAPTEQETGSPEDPQGTSRLFPFRQPGTNGKWGYMDRDGVVRIASQFRRADEFSEGRARAWAPSQRRSGYIDERGEFVFMLPKGCYSTRSFSEGLAAFSIGDWLEGKWGYLDREGKIVIEPKYDDARGFREGLACVNVGAQLDEYSGTMEGGKWGFIDKGGRWVVKPEFEYAASFCNGLARVWREKEWSYINETGKMVIPPQDWSPRRSSEGLARVRAGDKVGYIDRAGAIAIQPRFGEGQNFSEGLAAVRVGENWGFIDQSGAFVIHPDRRQGRPGLTNDVERFHRGLAKVHIGGRFEEPQWDDPHKWYDGAWYYMNRKGEIVRRIRRDDEDGPYYGEEIH